MHAALERYGSTILGGSADVRCTHQEPLADHRHPRRRPLRGLDWPKTERVTLVDFWIDCLCKYTEKGASGEARIDGSEVLTAWVVG